MEEDFRKKINHKLVSFEKKHKEWEWSDLIKWLAGLKIVLDRFDSIFSDEHLILLSKRLAQCLFPSLPHGLHSKTLEIYHTLLKKSSIKHIFILSSGLFQHFQYCAPQNKIFFLSILSENYINTPGLTLLTSGLIACLLSGAGDKQENLMKTMEVLESIENKTILHFFLWKNVLKSRKFKNVGLVFMQKRVDLSICEGLIVNSLLDALNDASVINKRLALDIIKNYYPIIQKNKEIVILMQGVLKLIKGKDHSLIRRLWEWAFPGEINYEQVNIVKDIMKDAVVLIFIENHEEIMSFKGDVKEIKNMTFRIIEEIIVSEGIGEEFLKDIAVEFIKYAILDGLIIDQTEKLGLLLITYSELFWDTVTIYCEANILSNESEILNTIQFSITYLKPSDYHLTKLLTILSTSLHNFANFSLSLSLCTQILKLIPHIPSLRLRHIRKKLKSLLALENKQLLLDYTYLISKLISDPQEISEIIAYLKLASGKHLLLALKSIINLSDKSLTDEDFQVLWRRVPSQNINLLEFLVSSFSSLPIQWNSGLVSLLLSMSRDEHIKSFIKFWEYSSKFHLEKLLEISRSGKVIFIMIDHLNDDNPTVRHAAKEWLNIAIKSLPCVIEPVIGGLLHQSTEKTCNNQGEYSYLHVFDSGQVQDALDKVSLLLLFSNTLTPCLMSLSPSTYIKSLLSFHKLHYDNYLELLLKVSLDFAQTQNPNQEQELSKVQASAAEVLRLLCHNLPDTYSFQLLENVSNIMYRALGTNLETSLLSVLKQLFQQKISFHYPSKVADVLVLGLRNDDYYLRDQWGKVISLALPSIITVPFNPAICNYLTVLLINYCDIIGKFKDTSMFAGLKKLIELALGLSKHMKTHKFKLVKTVIFNELERIFALIMNFTNADEVSMIFEGFSRLFPLETVIGFVEVWQKHVTSSSLQCFQKIIPRLWLGPAEIFDGILNAIVLKKYSELGICSLMYNVVEKLYHLMGRDNIWQRVINIIKLLEYGKLDEVLAWIIKLVHILLSISVPTGKNLKDLQKIIENILVKCEVSIVKWQKTTPNELTALPGTTVLEVILNSLVYSQSMFRVIYKNSQGKLIRIVSDLGKALLDGILTVDSNGETLTKLLSTILISFPLIFDSLKSNLLDAIKGNIFCIFEKFPQSIEYWYDIINTIPKQSIMNLLDVYDVVFWKSSEFKTEMLANSLAMISLILLSGTKDAYIGSLSFIQKRIEEVINLPKSSDKIFSLMCVLIRVLSVRFSDFSGIWTKYWPDLYTGLLKHMSQVTFPTSFNCLKFIDMMLITSPEFYKETWLYLFDVPEIELLPGHSYIDYKPIVSCFLKDFSARPSPTWRSELISDNLQRKVLITDNKVNSLEELEKYVKIIIQYTMLYSTERFEIDWKSVELSLRSEIISINGLLSTELT